MLSSSTYAAGVQRQYSGTGGRTENCQLGDFLAYSTSKGRTLIDRELYLPKSWTEDRDRCRDAAVTEEVGFATKTVQARQMLARALDAGLAPLTAGPPLTAQRQGRARIGLLLMLRAKRNQVHRYDAWYRHVTLAMLARTYLAVTAAIAPKALAAASSRSHLERSSVSWHT